MSPTLRRTTPVARSARPRRRPLVRRESTDGCVYVYGVLRAGEAMKPLPAGLGANATPVRLVEHRGLAAVVSDYGPGPLLPSRENLLVHARVNEAVMQQRTVLPMSFGTILADDADVVEMLRGGYESFRRALKRIDGHVEFGVKLVCDREGLGRRLERDDQDLRQVHAALESVRSEGAFLRVQYGRLLESSIDAEGERASAAVLARVGDLAAELHVDRPMGERVVLSLAALVSREKEATFAARLAQLGHELDGLSIRCTGPWPPYSFVRLRVRVDGPARPPRMRRKESIE